MYINVINAIVRLWRLWGWCFGTTGSLAEGRGNWPGVQMFHFVTMRSRSDQSLKNERHDEIMSMNRHFGSQVQINSHQYPPVSTSSIHQHSPLLLASRPLTTIPWKSVESLIGSGSPCARSCCWSFVGSGKGQSRTTERHRSIRSHSTNFKKKTKIIQ